MTQVIKEKDNIFSAYKLLAQAREGRDPAWLARLREKAGAAFESLDFPTTRNEEWKYTNVAPILKVQYRESVDPESNGLNSLTARDVEPLRGERARQAAMKARGGLLAARRNEERELGVVDLARDAREHAVELRQELGDVLAAEKYK